MMRKSVLLRVVWLLALVILSCSTEDVNSPDVGQGSVEVGIDLAPLLALGWEANVVEVELKRSNVVLLKRMNVLRDEGHLHTQFTDVPVGAWQATVTVYEDSLLIATGSASIQVARSHTSAVQILMRATSGAVDIGATWDYFVAECLSWPPTIDGNLTEWAGHPFGILPFTDVTEQLQVTAALYLGHCTDSLFIGLRLHTPASGVRALYVLFDEGDDGGNGSGTRDDCISVGQEDVKVWQAYYSPGDGYAGIHGWVFSYCDPDFKVASSCDNQGYSLEMAIPLSGQERASVDLSDLNCSIQDIVGMSLMYVSDSTSFYYPDGGSSEWEFIDVAFEH